MIRAGFDVSDEPFLQGMVLTLKQRLVLDLRTRARLLVKDACTLMGVVDASQTMEEGEVFLQYRDET
ncbi:hypothetical protein SARC_17819, partial [Sphaeroforma arctica JP610]